MAALLCAFDFTLVDRGASVEYAKHTPYYRASRRLATGSLGEMLDAMEEKLRRDLINILAVSRRNREAIDMCVLVGKVGRIVNIKTWSSLSDLSQPSGHPTHNKTHRRQTKQVQTEQRQTYPEHKGTPRGSAQLRQLKNKPTNGAARHIPRGT